MARSICHALARPEEWRPVPGFENVFLASSEGRVARIEGFDYNGYRAVSVVRSAGLHPVLTGGMNGKDGSLVITVHRMVALTFLGEPPAGKTDVNHLDGDKKNNAARNLQWATRAENLEHARQTGLQTDPLRKYTRKQYEEAREMRARGIGWNAIARHLHMTIGGAWHAVMRSPKGRTRQWHAQA